MRIGVDAHYAIGPYQGILTYLLELYGALARADHSHEMVFLLPKDSPPDVVAEWSALGEVARLSEPSRLGRSLGGMAAAARATSLDLLHTQTVSPIRLPCRSLVTVHDLLFVTHPQYFNLGFRLQLGMALRWTARKADALVVISDYTLDAVRAKLGPGTKAYLAPNGVNHEQFNPEGTEQAKEWVAANYGVTRDFILTVGRMDMRKNHERLISAYQRVLAHTDSAHMPDLVIIGQPAYGYERIMVAAEPLFRSGRLRVLSNVPTAALPQFYRACTLFAFPSLAEGFGLPPLEAMACGAPVVASRTTAVGEVVGDAGILVDPDNGDDIANGITRMLDDLDMREKYVQAGLARASQYSWDRSAAGFLEAVQHLE